MGVPALTSDLSGYGMFMESRINKMREGLMENDFPGISILHRFNKSYDEQLKEFVTIFTKFVALQHVERVRTKTNAKYLATLADWERLIEHYFEAHNLALDRVKF